MNIAVAHEHFIERGGGEMVAEALADAFDCKIYTGLHDEGIATDGYDVEPIFGDGMTGKLMRKSFMFRDLLYQAGWQVVEELHDYDVIVQSGNNPAWYVPRDHQTIIKYVHSTPRNPYDLLHTAGKFTRVYAFMARLLYHHTTAYPDTFVFNSELTMRRGELYWGLDRSDSNVGVVYPPVPVDDYSPDRAETQDFYMTVSRLIPAKGIEAMVEAFRGLDEVLVIAGAGPERDRLEPQAPDNVEFTGYISDDHKQELMSAAKAGIFNAYGEDFGIVPIEFMASGTPVIGVRDGFTQHQIIDGTTGILYDRGELRQAIETFDDNNIDDESLVMSAGEYRPEQFEQQMQDIVDATTERTAI